MNKRSEFNLDISGLIISMFGLAYSQEFWNMFDIKIYYYIGEWFTAVIIVLYLIFPFFRYCYLKSKVFTILSVSIIFLINLKYEILTYEGGWYSISNALMCFLIGFLFQDYKEILENNRKIFYFAISFVIIYYVISPYEILQSHCLASLLFSSVLFFILYEIKYSNIFINYISNYNYEIYLVHHQIQRILIPFFLYKYSSDFQKLATFIISFGLILIIAKYLREFCNILLKKGTLNDKHSLISKI